MPTVALPQALMPVLAYIRANEKRYIDALRDLVRIPSATTDLAGCERCCDALFAMTEQAGLAPRRDTGPMTAPVIFSRLPSTVPGRTGNTSGPILIGYAHYDVKPEGNPAAWRFAPYGAEIHDGRMYGRGVVDNKSGCLALVFAAEACRKTTGMPLDLRIVLEGEEETGSAHLEDWALAHRADLEGGAGLFCLDGSVEASRDLPRVDLFGRGLLYVELICETSTVDVHSGRSALAHNAAWRLIDALTTIKDTKSDRVIVPGWSDDLIKLTDDDWEYIRQKSSEFDEESVRRQYGQRLPGFPGARTGDDVLRAYYTEPSCSITGFWSGHTDPGVIMTVVPNKATVKIDFRCPPNLSTKKQAQKLREHLDRAGYRDMTMNVLTPAGHPWHTSHRAAIVRAIRQAGLDVFGRERLSASGPTQEGVFAMNFGTPPVLTGFANADCRIHAPDENLVLEYYIKGIEYAAAIFHRFAETVGA
jgi:acetylornithine deacetylase/succinyl-diaminopimelate desuccinylase-like protein